MTTQNLKRKKVNNHLPDRKRTREPKRSVTLKCLSTKQVNPDNEEILRQSEQRYRTLVEESFDGIFIQERSKIIFANQRLYEMLGYDQEELVGLNHWMVYHSEYRELTRTRAQARMQGEKVPSQYEVKLQRKDGSSFDGEINARKIMVDNKPGVQVWVRDITDRKQAEQVLRSERDKFRGMLLAIHDGVDIVNCDYIIEFQNKILQELFGDKIGEKCYAAYMGLEEPCHFCSIQEAIKTGSSVRVELVGKDGRNYELNSSPFTDVDGNVKVIELVRDITERKRAEDALRESEKKYRTILKNIADGYYEVDLAGNLTFFNDSVSQLLGYTKEELMGMNDQQYTDRENAKKLYQAFNKVYRTGEPTQVFDWEIIRKDGVKRFIEASVSLIKDSKGKPTGFRGIVRDSTERKCAEEALYIEKQRFQVLSDNAPFGMVMINKDGDYEYINPKFKELFGYDLSDVPDGRTWFKKAYLDPTYRHYVISCWINDLKSSKPGEKRSRIFTANCKDGTKKIVNFISVQLERSEQLMACEDITERKQAEEALRESEERYRTILENIEDGYYEVDLHGNFTFFNDSLRRMLGYSREEMLGMGNQQYTTEENRKKLFQAFNEVYRTGESTKGFGWEVFRKDGKKLFGEVSVSLIKNSKGQPIGFRGIARDITERKRVEEEIKQTLSLLNATLESTADGILVADGKGKIESFNRRFVQMWRIPESIIALKDDDQALAFVLDQLKDPEDFLSKVKELYSQPTAESFDLLEFKDGRFFERYSLPQWIGDQCVGRVWSFRDVTEHKKAEEALRNEKQRFQSLSENAPFGMVMIDKDGTFRYINPKFRELFGYDLNDIPDGKTWFRKAYPDPAYRHDVISTWVNDLKSSKPGEKRSQVFKANCKDGTEKIVNFIPVRLETGENLMACEDITQHKQAEQEMKALEEQFRQSQKMEAVGRLAGGIAHDFNNLLTVIKGYSQLSLLDLRENDPLWENIQEIQKATQRAADLTRQLLAFSRRQILDLKVLSLNTLLKDLNKMLRRIISEDIELVTLLAEDLGRVRIDPGQFEQMILNLAVNAKDAMPSGGKLTIETSNVELDKDYARTHISVKPGPCVQLSVSDTGVGISSDLKEKVFEPFFTTKEKGKGTGLGLSTVYGIVKQCEGNIWIYSEPGHGTTIKIYLPRVEGELDSPFKREETDFLPRGNETVLLVEDDPLVRNLAHRLLMEQGYTVLEATNGEEALRLAGENDGEKIHLLLTDVVMPQMGGKELAEKLKLSRPDIEILYTSGYTDNAIVHHGVLESGTHFLQKPFSHKTLSHKVREVLDR